MYPPPQFYEGRLLLSLELGNALLDGDGFLPQVFEIPFQLGDDLISGPETPWKVALATTATGAAVMMLPVSTGMVSTTSAIHCFTSLPLSTW